MEGRGDGGRVSESYYHRLWCMQSIYGWNVPFSPQGGVGW